MTEWWEKLPEGSVILDSHNRASVWSEDDGYWLAGNWVVTPIPPIKVIYVPVTDEEPPVGSLVETQYNVWMRFPERGDGKDTHWGELICPARNSNWKRLRHDATRILRWGE
jgi:hypothetical protein